MHIGNEAKTSWRRCLMRLASVLPCLMVWSVPVQAASSAWAPEGPVEISVGAGPGTPTDTTIRTIGKLFQELRILSVPVTHVNRPGAGGEIGLLALSQHPGDAHYMFIEPINILTNDITGKSKFTYRDFTPLAILFSQYVVFAVRTDSSIKSGADLVAALKKDPSSLSIAIGTTLGNSNHIALGLLMKAAGGELRGLKTVVFSGAAAAKTALLGGHVDVLVSPDSTVIPQLKSGSLRVIGIAAPRRIGGAFAGVPTWKEQGVDVVFSTWRSMVAPKGLSEAQVRFWDESFGKLARSAGWKQYLDRFPTESGYMSSMETAAFFERQHGQLRGILGDLGLAKK